MGKYTEYKSKVQNGTSLQAKSKYRQYKEQKDTSLKFDNFSKELNDYIESNNQFLNNYKERFFDKDGNYISNKYREDSKGALHFANSQKNILEKQRQELLNFLVSYSSNFEPENVLKTQNYLNEAGAAYENIIKTYDDDNKLFSSFETEDEFNKWYEEEQQKDELRKVDLLYEANQIAILELDSNNLSVLDKKSTEAWIELQKAKRAYEFESISAEALAKAQAEYDAAVAAVAEYESRLESMGGTAALHKTLYEKKKLYEKAKEFQETEALTTKALNAPDFKETAQKGSEWGADTNFEFYGKDKDRGTYGFFNREKNDLISYYRNNLSSYENEAANMANGPTKKMEKAYHFAKEMTEDEYNIYAYYLGKDDTDSAQKYLDSIEQSITYRFAENFYEQNLKDANIFEQIVFGLSAGTEQFQTGLENLISDETEFDSSYRQLISGKVQEDLKDSTFGKVAYDLSVTTGNMLPSIITSAVVGFINPVAGQIVGSTLMGASAKGNAYAEMINLGYTKEQASNYSTLVGASEAGLQSILGHIGKLGGSVSSKVISSAVSKIDNAFARAAIQFVGGMLSEGAEEYLQEVLDPFFKNIAFGEDNDIRFISEDALYSGLLGALSAGILDNVPGIGEQTIANSIKTYRTGKQLKAAGVTAEQLSELGSKLSVDSEAYKLAGRINENTGAYTIGRMFNELNAEITAQNKAEIKEALRAKGINPVSANSIANWMERVVAGEELTAKQKAALEKNPVLGEVMRDVLYERNTTALQRQAGLDSISSQLEEYQIKQALDKEIKKAEKKKAKNAENNTPDIQDTQNTAQQAEIEGFGAETDTSLAESEKANEANPRVSDNGRTFSTKTGEDLDIVGIASTKDKTFKTADGQTVNSKDVSFATENEAVLFDSVLNMDLPTEIANAIIDGYIPSDNISVTDYLLGSNLAYRYGYAGAKDIELMLDSDVRNIPEHLSKGLYNLGREIAKAEASKEQAEIDSKKAQKSENKSKKKGSVTFDGKELSKEFEDSLTDIQRESIKGIKVIAEVLGNDVNLFASYIAKEGPYKDKRVYKDSNGIVKLAPNGFYNPDGSINLDINSGNLGEGTILYTLSHELTHHIRKWSPAKFKVLADFVVEQYSGNGIKINDLVYEQIAKAKKNGKSISYGTAYEEVIADACSTMLLDSNAIEKLAQKDKNLFEKIKSFIKDFIDKINKLYKNFSPDAKEAQYVKDIKGMTDKLQALWFEGLEDASEANSTSVETTETKYQLREYSKHQKENWKNSKKIVLYENVIQFEAFINEARTNNQFVKKMYFGSIPNDLAILIKQKTGINVENYNCSLGANEIRKIFKDHGDEDFESLRGQRAITIADIKNIPAVIQSPDDIVLSETPYNGKPVIRFVKDINGKITISAVVSDKHLDLFVQTAYAGAKKRSLATATDEQAPVNTPEATRSTAPNTGSLPQNSESSQGKFSLRESVEETKDLVAVHNLSEEKLLKSLQLGGLPMPSIAIIRAKEGHENFGTISLVFGKETIDPQFFRSNKVYSGDAWTPTYPRVEYKIDENVVEKGVDEVKRLIKSKGFGKDDFGYLSSISEDSFKYGNTDEVANKTALKVAYLIDKGIDFKPVYKEGQLSDFGRFDNFVVKHIAEALGKERIVELHNNSEGVKSAVEEIRNFANKYKANKYKDNEKLFAELSKNPFYGENNFGFSQAHEIVEGAYKYFNNGSLTKIDEWETKNVIADLIDKTDYKKWVNNLFDGFIAKEGIRNNKDLFTPSGNRRSFEALHYEHNLENVIKAMKEEGSKGVGAFGGGNIFGASTTEISSIADIKNNAEKRLQSLSDEEFSEIKKGFADRFFELASSLPNNKDSFTATDDAANVLVEAISKYKTKSGIANYIRRECQGWATYSDYVVDDLIELVSDIQQMPTKYFEAKPQRAVGFDEVKAVIIPDNSSAELKSALKSKSFNVLEYQSGNEQDRAAVLNSIEDVKFSDRDSDGNTLSKEQQEFFKDSKVRDKDGNLLVVYHGTRKADFTVFKRNINFFTDDKEMADSYAYNSEMYTGYLNIVNPYIIDAKGEKWSRIPIDTETKNMLTEYGVSTFKEDGKWRTTPADIAYAIEDGIDNGDFDYDGIIIRNINDTGSYYKSNDNIIADDYITFNSNQFKNADNKTPTSDTDIRYSDRDPDSFESRQEVQKQLVKENAILKEDNILLKELVALQRKVTNGTILKKSSVDAVSKKIMKQLNVKGNTQELSKLLSGVYSYILRGTEVTWEDITEKAQPAINWIYDNMQTEKVVDEYTLGVLREIRKSRVSLDETQKAEINAVLGSYKDFQKYTLGKIIIAKDGLSMDSWWGEMNEKYPNIFDSDISSSDMPTALIGILDNLSNSLYEEVYNYQSEMTKQDVLTEIYDGYWDVSTLHTVADQNQKKINELKAKHKEKLSKVRSSHNKKIVELKNKHKQEIKEIKAALREKSLQKEQDIRTKYQESRQKSIEGREKTALRHKIKKVVSELNNLLLKGTKDKHIIEELQKVVADSLLAINMDTLGAEQRLNGYTDENGVYHKGYNQRIAEATDPDTIKKLTKTRDRIQLQGNSINDKLKALRDAYEKIKNSDDVEIRNAYHDVITEKIKDVVSSVGDTPVKYMNMEQLESVYDMYRMILTAVRTSNKAFRAAKGETITQLSEAVNSEVYSIGGEKQQRLKALSYLNKWGWDALKPVYAFRTIGSKTLTDLYNNLRGGEDIFYKDAMEAADFIKSQYEKHGYSEWDMKKTKTFEAKSGKSFDLSLEQIMSVYAYSRREQAHDHLVKGGIVFEDAVVETKKLGIPVKYEVNTKSAFNLSEGTLVDIISSLTDEQKAFVDEMQEYLSTVMGAKGNEVSMEMYGVKLYKEKYYFPLKSSQYYMNFNPEEAGEVRLKNPSFSKATVDHANNPVVLSNFTDVWANHVNDMSMYHAFTLALEDFTRVYNYKTKTDENAETISTEATLASAYGTGVTQYIRNFLKDLNGGVRVQGTPVDTLIGLAKKGAVFASASVVIQQISAVARAMAYINPKYFVFTAHKSANVFNHKKDWEELKTYAPVAGIKEMGYFDTGLGRSTVDWIKSQDTLMSKADDIFAKAPALADEFGWTMIWQAIKKETANNNPSLAPNSEAFLRKAGERFTEVVSLTQVYDSVFARSGVMRNKNGLMKMLTAFMAEPTVQLNMLFDMVVQSKRIGGTQGAKFIASASGAVIASIVFNSMLKSLVIAARDDDDDETYAEKYAEAFVGDLKDNMNPLTLIPVVKDVVSIFRGYDVTRMDMNLFSDLKKAIDGFDSEDKSLAEKWADLTGAISAFFGIPVKNVKRDIMAVINTYNTVTNSNKTTEQSFMDAIKEGWTGDEKPKKDKLYDAIVGGDKTYVERLKKQYKDDKSYENAVRKALRENDPRIKEAAEAGYDGDVAERVRIAKEIIAEGNFSQDIVVEAINAEINAIKKKLDSEEDEAEDVEEKKSIYSTKDISTALEDGDATLAKEIIADIVSVKVENYMAKDEDLKQKEAEKKAKTSVKSSLSEYWKPLYIEAYKSKNTEEMKRIRFVLKDTGLYGSAGDIIDTCNSWIKNSRK